MLCLFVVSAYWPALGAVLGISGMAPAAIHSQAAAVPVAHNDHVLCIPVGCGLAECAALSGSTGGDRVFSTQVAQPALAPHTLWYDHQHA